MRALSSILISILVPLAAAAHEGGHGPAIPGVGAHGGAMTAIVLATDIDKNENAPVQGVAEWKLEGKKLHVWLLDASTKRSRHVLAGELKWILLGAEGTAPVIVKVPMTSTASELQLDLSSDAHVIEAILPGFGDQAVKHVFAIEP